MNAIILAAGLSRRMKTQKLLLPFGRGTLLSTVVQHVIDAMFDGIVLVVSKETQGVGLRLSPLVTEVVNESPERGQASSLRLGLSAMEESGFCVMLADLPLVSPEEILRYRALFDARGEGRSALVPFRGGHPGHPSFFAAPWRERFYAAEGDVGGRAILAAHSDEILFTEGEGSFFADIDTPEVYERITKEHKGGKGTSPLG